jgi:hypothetical protein
MYGMQLPLARLGRPGLYVWTLVVQSPSFGDLCASEGYFILVDDATWEAE